MKAQDAVKFYGSQEALAKELGLKQPSIAGWVKSGEVPELRQLQIEAATGGELKADKRILQRKKNKSKCAA